MSDAGTAEKVWLCKRRVVTCEVAVGWARRSLFRNSRAPVVYLCLSFFHFFLPPSLPPSTGSAGAVLQSIRASLIPPSTQSQRSRTRSANLIGVALLPNPFLESARRNEESENNSVILLLRDLGDCLHLLRNACSLNTFKKYAGLPAALSASATSAALCDSSNVPIEGR